MSTQSPTLRHLMLASALLASGTSDATTRSAPTQFLPGSYSATLQTRAQVWQLLDDNGAVTQLSFERCGARIELPPGLWLLTRDPSGRLKLIAPSATPLPEGHASEIAVSACGDARPEDAVQLPAALLTTLEAHANSILVQR